MLYVKTLHIISMVTWFCGLFYLPRLFVYHAMSKDEISLNRFIIMERKLYYGIMMPGAILTIFFGIYLLSFNLQTYLRMPWLHLKLGLVILLLIYHFYLGYLLKSFKLNQLRHGHVFYRILNEIPVIFLILIVFLVIVKPFGIH